MRVFLSHSSDNKDYVNCVAKNISSDEVIIDESSFIPGRLSSEEMERLIMGCDIFVFFISSSSLENKNVKYEIEQYEKSSFSNNKRFIPLVIEDGIKYSDSRIPEWMRDYNIRRVYKPKKAVACIDETIRLMTWKKYDFLKRKDSIFRGRNEYVEKFEHRFNDRKLGKAVCYCVSGFETIGRTTLLNYCLKKVGKIRQEYTFPSFNLNSTDSIEDFIFKLDELGVAKPALVENLSTKTVDEKIRIASEQLNNFIENDEVVHIVDNGCIITNNGGIAEWFRKLLDSVNAKNLGAKLAISAKYKCNALPSSKMWNISIPEFSPTERQWLLEAYLDLYGISLPDNEFEICLNWLQGYPQQILLLAQGISEQGFSAIKEKSNEIVGFNMHKIEGVLAKYIEDDKKMSFIVTLAKPELLKVSDILYSFGNDEFYTELLTELLSLSICVFVGVSNEYIRINDTVRDYLNRKRFRIDSSALEKLRGKILSDFKKDRHGIPDSSELYFFMNDTIMRNNIESIDEKFIFPSHFAKCMRDIYNKRENDNEVIKIAEYLISKKKYIDTNVLKSAYYYLCLALARKKEYRVIQESIHLDDADKCFVQGFYYRKVGEWRESITSLEKAISINSKHKRAKRELVTAYMRLYEYDNAFLLAEESYNDDPSNIYFSQAYFKCLLSRYVNNKDDNIEQKLEYIINKTVIGDDERDQSMIACMRAEYEFYVNNNEFESYEILNKCISDYPKNIYTLFTKFNIAERSNNIKEMEQAQKKIKDIIKDSKQYEDVITRNDILIIAHVNGQQQAMAKIEKLSSIYSESYKNKLREDVIKVIR